MYCCLIIVACFEEFHLISTFTKALCTVGLYSVPLLPDATFGLTFENDQENFKDPEFRNLFIDYMKEISDPQYRRHAC